MRDRTTAEKLDFAGDVAVVTGGAQGIGRGIGEAFGALGATVVVADVAADRAGDTADEIADAYDVEATAVETDVSSYDDATAMVETVRDEFGRLDVLVNNAGIGEGKRFVDSSPGEWDDVIGVCLYGTLNCTHAALPHMIDRGEGVVVNFASDSYKGNDPNLAVYGGAKASNVAFTRTVAKEVGGTGVRLNCVSPGTTRTPATEDWIDEYGDRIRESYALDRLGRPEDIADAVVFLASDAADWITGEVLSVNGGYVRG